MSSPVFIGGCGRSGTTLLGSMLGAHPDAICTPESHFKVRILDKLGGNPKGISPSDTLALIKKYWRFKLWELPFDDTSSDSYADLLLAIAMSYGEKVGKLDVSIWVDHTPENISYALRLQSIYPDAKFIHIIRDGRGVAASFLPLDWGPNSIIKAAGWWMEKTAYGLALESHLPSDQIMRVKYEDLVIAPEQTLRTLCEFLGWDYDSVMLKADGFIPPGYTTRQHSMVGRAPDPSLADRWKTKLSPRQIEIFEVLTRDFLEMTGYQPLTEGRVRGASPLEKLSSTLSEGYRSGLINPIRWLRRSHPYWLSPDFLRYR